jgi:hypothetical protein
MASSASTQYMLDQMPNTMNCVGIKSPRSLHSGWQSEQYFDDDDGKLRKAQGHRMIKF